MISADELIALSDDERERRSQRWHGPRPSHMADIRKAVAFYPDLETVFFDAAAMGEVLLPIALVDLYQLDASLDGHFALFAIQRVPEEILGEVDADDPDDADAVSRQATQPWKRGRFWSHTCRPLSYGFQYGSAARRFDPSEQPPREQAACCRLDGDMRFFRHVRASQAEQPTAAQTRWLADRADAHATNRTHWEEARATYRERGHLHDAVGSCGPGDPGSVVAMDDLLSLGGCCEIGNADPEMPLVFTEIAVDDWGHKPHQLALTEDRRPFRYVGRLRAWRALGNRGHTGETADLHLFYDPATRKSLTLLEYS